MRRHKHERGDIGGEVGIECLEFQQVRLRKPSSLFEERERVTSTRKNLIRMRNHFLLTYLRGYPNE